MRQVVAEGSYTRNPQTGTYVQLSDILWKNVEPATRIERATCGLRNFQNPTADNQTPQETTNQDAHDIGPDGAGFVW
jgi:hypothetical protein